MSIGHEDGYGSMVLKFYNSDLETSGAPKKNLL